jgi:hypothetical protein
MLHSGRWRGYWEQGPLGRQEMHDLALEFDADGRVRGQGADMVGLFAVEGQAEPDGAIRLVKTYLRGHSVIYAGRYDGEGKIFGQWIIPGFDTGRFALAPELTPPPADAPIRDL